MDETETSLPSPTPVPETSLTDLITGLDAKVVSTLESKVQNLQSLQQGGQLDQETLKKQMQEILSLGKASLLIRTLPGLVTPSPVKVPLQTSDLFTKLQQVGETLTALCRNQMRQAIASKAAKILEQIQAKEQVIREQIDQKQQQVAQIVQDKMTVH
jgi:hypothetical protein